MSGDITSQTETLLGAPSPRIMKHSYHRNNSNNTRQVSSGREVLKSSREAQTISVSSDFKEPDEKADQTGRISTPNKNHSVLRMMSELN